MSPPAQKIHTGLTLLGCFSCGSLYGWSGYMPAVRDAYTLSHSSASMVFSLALVSFTFGVLLAPLLLARVPPRLRLSLLSGLAILSLLGSAASPQFAGFAFGYGVCFGFLCGLFYNHAVSTAAQSETANLLVPVTVAAFGFGGAVFGAAQIWLSAAGWGVWATIPALACLGFVTLAGIAFNPPHADAIARKTSSAMLTRPDGRVILLWAIFATGSCAGLVVLGFASQFVSSDELRPELASFAVFLAASGNTLGRLSSALTARWVGARRAVACALGLSVISLSSLLVTSAPSAVIGFLFGAAFGYGQLAAAMPLLVRAFVRPSQFSTAFGWVFTGWGIAGLLGPWTAGRMLDASGSLQLPLIISTGFVALSLWFVLRIAPANDPDTQS